MTREPEFSLSHPAPPPAAPFGRNIRLGDARPTRRADIPFPAMPRRTGVAVPGIGRMDGTARLRKRTPT